MMNKKDVLELRRRMKKDSCTFTRISGCYVDAEKNKIAEFNNSFLNLEDEVFYKYLEMAKKVLSGKIGNNIMALPFKEKQGEQKRFLLGLKESLLKNDALLETFYDSIIDNYISAGNYLIVIFHDAYDILTKTTDNQKLDESEEVYEYLLCAICPVNLSKPALGNLKEENEIGARIRDWIVGAPETGFVYPAFSDRSSDVDTVMFYTKNAKEPHMELAQNFLGTECKMTIAEKKETFTNVIADSLGDENEDIICEIQEKLKEMSSPQDESDNDAPKELTSNAFAHILHDCGLSEDSVTSISAQYDTIFESDLPLSEQLVDDKILEKAEYRRKIMDSVEEIKKKIGYSNDTDINVVVKKELKASIREDNVNGQRYLMIPLTENAVVTIAEKENLLH